MHGMHNPFRQPLHVGLTTKCDAWPETGWPVGSSQALELEFFFVPSYLFV